MVKRMVSIVVIDKACCEAESYRLFFPLCGELPRFYEILPLLPASAAIPRSLVVKPPFPATPHMGTPVINCIHCYHEFETAGSVGKKWPARLDSFFPDI